MLRKVVPRMYVPGTPGVPAKPGHPPIPAWDEVVTVAQQQAALGQGGPALALLLNSNFLPVYNELTQSYEYVQVPAGVDLQGLPAGQSAGSVGVSFGAPPGLHDLVIHHAAVPGVKPTPAVPATAAQWAAANGLAWDAGAYSLAVLDGDLQTTFNVPQVVGVMIGFTHQPSQQNYRALSHAIYFASNLAQVREAGQAVGPSLPFTPSDTWSIRRAGGVVSYAKNDAVFYTSLQKSQGPLIVEAVLYGADDRVI